MKKAALLLALASVVVIEMQSCKKEPSPKLPVAETHNIQLKANESYTFTLPQAREEYRITTQGSHYTISEVGKDASGNMIYRYTPVQDYTGTDQVVLSNAKDEHPPQHGNCGSKPSLLPPPKHSHGDCDKDKGDHYIVTINFTMEKSTQGFTR